MSTHGVSRLTGLMTAGFIALTGGCDWSDLDGIPAGFADGVDNEVAAGTGLVDEGAGTIGVDFEGTGSGLGVEDTVARSDHDHDADYVNVTGDTMTGNLTINTDLIVKDVIQAGTVYSIGDYNKLGTGTPSSSIMGNNGDLFVTDDLEIGDDLWANGNIFTNGDFRYLTARTRYASVAPAAFTAQSESWDHTIGFVYACMDTGPGTLLAPIQLPHGATVTNVTAYVQDNSSSYFVRVALNRNPLLNTSSFQKMAETTTTVSGASASVQALSDSSIAYATVDNNSYGYFASAYFSGGGSLVHIRGVRVTYTVYTPLP